MICSIYGCLKEHHEITTGQTDRRPLHRTRSLYNSSGVGTLEVGVEDRNADRWRYTFDKGGASEALEALQTWCAISRSLEVGYLGR